MKVLVLGGTGRIGNAIVRALLEAGDKVTVVSRRSAPGENLEGLGVRYISGDADRTDQIDTWVKGSAAVVDAAAPYQMWLFQHRPAATVLARAKRRLAALLTSVGRNRAKLVFISANTTEQPSRSLLDRTQAGALRVLHPYFRLKQAQEAMIHRAMQDGLPATVISPTYCIGPYDISEPKLALIPMLANGELPATVEHPLNVIDSRDVAAMVISILKGGTYGQRISVVGHNATLDMLADLVCRKAGVARPKYRTLPAIAAAATYAREAIMSVGLHRPDYPSVGTLLMLEQRWAFPAGAQLELGVPLRPLSRTVAEALEWYLARGVLAPAVAQAIAASAR